MKWNPAEVLKGEHLPAALVDLDVFDRNIEKTVRMVQSQGNKTVRLATKSLRAPELISRALKKGGPVFRGVMCFSAQEALSLHQYGLDDFLVAYPTLQPSDLHALRQIHNAGGRVTIVTDHPEQISALAQAMHGTSRPFRTLIDVDMSWRPLGGLLHIGVRRSRIRSVADTLALCEEIKKFPDLQVDGLLAYEAQVAGLTDRNPFKKLLNPLAHWIRKASIPHVARLRAEIVQAMRAHGYSVGLVNGAGTGSLDFALIESTLTEVTVGSGFLSPHLFDYYSNIRFEPAAFFALQAVRTSDPGFVTCQGGGYIASGEPGWDRVPIPVWPEGLRLVSAEGAGEVQTPLRLPKNTSITLGSPILFRHAKAGELAERFNEYLLISSGKITGRAKTYRGLGISSV
ncbi:alanine racemase [Bdellovibrionota bacterium FG-1]